MKKTPLANEKGTPPDGEVAPRPIPTGDVQEDNPEPPVKEPVEEGSKVDKLKAEQDKRLDALFSDDPAPVVEKPVEKKQEPTLEEKPADKKVEGDDINFDNPPEGAAKERESLAQQHARENGRALKETKTMLQERDLELNRVKEELETLRKAAPQNNYREEDFARHPEVISIKRDILVDRDAVAQTQTHSEIGKVVVNKFGNYMSQFLAGKSETDDVVASQIENNLRKSIGDDFKEAYKGVVGDDFDPREMESEARAFTKDMLQLIVRNAGKTEQIQEKLSTLVTKAREGNLAQGVEMYQAHESDIRSALKAIPEIPQAVIDENPHTVEATVAVLLKQPAWKERFESTEKQVLELILGPRALSQKELDAMQAGGVSVSDFSKQRQKSYIEKRRKLAVSITQALLLRGLWESTSRKASAHDDSHSELDALSRSKPKDPDPPAPKPVVRKASEFVSAIEEYLK